MMLPDLWYGSFSVATSSLSTCSDGDPVKARMLSELSGSGSPCFAEEGLLPVVDKTVDPQHLDAAGLCAR